MSVATMTNGRNDEQRLAELGIERCPMCGQLDAKRELTEAGCSQCTHPCAGCGTVDIAIELRTCKDCKVCPSCDRARTSDDFVGARCWDCSQEGPTATASVPAMGVAA